MHTLKINETKITTENPFNQDHLELKVTFNQIPPCFGYYCRFLTHPLTRNTIKNIHGHVQKKVPFLAKVLHWFLHLHLDFSKFDLRSWVIHSVWVVKLKDCSFYFWRSHWKQTKHSGDIVIFFTVIFMILVERKCILQKWYSLRYHSN